MPAPFERRAISFEGKPVIFYVSAAPRLARPFLARCHGATLSAQEEGVSEDDYVTRILATAAEMGLAATLQKRDDLEIMFDVKAAAAR